MKCYLLENVTFQIIVICAGLPHTYSSLLSARRFSRFSVWEKCTIWSAYLNFLLKSYSVKITSKSYEGKTSCVEKWYATEYNLTKISPERIKVCRIFQWFSITAMFYVTRLRIHMYRVWMPSLSLWWTTTFVNLVYNNDAYDRCGVLYIYIIIQYNMKYDDD